MSTRPIEISEYKAVWLLVMFDLPVKTKVDRRRYGRFRNLLLGEGFSQLQFSVYARPFPSEESGEPCRNRLTRALPEHGHVRLLLVTDRQFAKMRTYFGKNHVPPEEPMRQVLLF
jgi:CRISPR-associated protein Cas2